MSKNRFLIVFCYITLYIVWGSTYFFIKMAVETLPPIWLLGLRFTLGGALLLALSASSGRIRTRPTWSQIGAAALLGTLLLLVGNGLITVAEQEVDSYLVALILASTPVAVAFFDRFLLGKRVSPVRVGGIATGILGVALLLYTGDAVSTLSGPYVGMAIGGMAAWGFSTSLGHRIRTYPDPLTNSGMQMLWVGVVSLAIALCTRPPTAELIAHVSARSLWGTLYLAVIGTSGFWAYTTLIADEPAIRVSSYSLVNPVIATLLGLLVGNETAVPLLGAGLPLVILGVSLMLYGESALGWLQSRRTADTQPG